MDYTLKEAAEALGLTKNTVKGRLQKLPAESTYKGDDGKIRITPEAFQSLQETVKQPEPEPEDSQSLQIVIDLLREQLAVKDSQIAALTAALAAAQALHAGAIQQQRLTDGTSSFWKRFKNRFL